jgi:hypothetical protein
MADAVIDDMDDGDEHDVDFPTAAKRARLCPPSKGRFSRR